MSATRNIESAVKLFFALLLCLSLNDAYAQGDADATPVTVTEVVSSNVAPTVPAAGTVFSRHETQITAGMAGRLEYLAEPGDYVEAGASVAIFDCEMLELQRGDRLEYAEGPPPEEATDDAEEEAPAKDAEEEAPAKAEEEEEATEPPPPPPKVVSGWVILAPALIGVFFGLSRVWDAFSDPIVGYWSDRTRSRLGRRRPWIALSALPLALLFVALWSPPSSLEGGGLATWMALAICCRIPFSGRFRPAIEIIVSRRASASLELLACRVVSEPS